eukprot:scaffold37669_cov43-Phaeocystis_antarctica.AAC.1
MPRRSSARQSHLSALAGHAVHSFHAKRSAVLPDLADLLPALRRSQCSSMPPDGDAFTLRYSSHDTRARCPDVMRQLTKVGRGLRERSRVPGLVRPTKN